MKKFSFKECMKLMRASDAMTQEDGFHWLLPRAHEHVEELIREFENEKNIGLRCWLLELLGEAKSDLALPVFQECINDNDEMLRGWAISGLETLDTRESRTTLYRHNANQFD